MQDAISLSRAWYVALAAIAAVAAWFIFKTGDPIASDRDSSGNPITPRERTRHDELLEARAHIRRQMEILRTPMRGRDYTRLSQETIEKLQAELDGIEEELGGSNPAG